MVARFGAFTLDVSARRLLRDGRAIHLSPKAFDLLRLLVDRYPSAVSKKEALEYLWPDTYVVEANVANLMAEVRAALDDSPPQQSFIRTVARYGYAFIAEVTVIADERTPSDAAESNPPDSRLVSPSLAVLPFANTSHDTEEEYFSDGLAGEIINALSHLPSVNVIARTSAFAFKGKSEDIRKIADALGVTHILEGSVRRIGSRLRVTAHLAHAADGTQLWSERYDRDLTDVFAVQDEIATAIAVALSVTLPRTNGGVSRTHEPGLPAYEAYLKGRYHLPTRLLSDSRQATSRAVALLKEAILLAPDWAEPHVTLAHLYFFLAELGVGSLDEMLSIARAEAQRALALAPAEPNSKAVLGAIAASYDYDWHEANRQFRSSLVSESLPPAVHDLYAVFYLSPLGQFEAAIEQEAKAIARDPLNMLWRVHQLVLLIYAGMYGRAIREALNVLQFESGSYLAQFAIAQRSVRTPRMYARLFTCPGRVRRHPRAGQVCRRFQCREQSGGQEIQQ